MSYIKPEITERNAYVITLPELLARRMELRAYANAETMADVRGDVYAELRTIDKELFTRDKTAYPLPHPTAEQVAYAVHRVARLGNAFKLSDVRIALLGGWRESDPAEDDAIAAWLGTRVDAGELTADTFGHYQLVASAPPPTRAAIARDMAENPDTLDKFTRATFDADGDTIRRALVRHREWEFWQTMGDVHAALRYLNADERTHASDAVESCAQLVTAATRAHAAAVRFRDAQGRI